MVPLLKPTPLIQKCFDRMDHINNITLNTALSIHLKIISLWAYFMYLFTAHSTDFVMSNVITYDIWIFTIVCLCMDNFLPNLVCLCRTILPAAFYHHCLPFECMYHALTNCHM